MKKKKSKTEAKKTKGGISGSVDPEIMETPRVDSDQLSRTQTRSNTRAYIVFLAIFAIGIFCSIIYLEYYAHYVEGAKANRFHDFLHKMDRHTELEHIETGANPEIERELGHEVGEQHKSESPADDRVVQQDQSGLPMNCPDLKERIVEKYMPCECSRYELNALMRKEIAETGRINIDIINKLALLSNDDKSVHTLLKYSYYQLEPASNLVRFIDEHRQEFLGGGELFGGILSKGIIVGRKSDTKVLQVMDLRRAIMDRDYEKILEYVDEFTPEFKETHGEFCRNIKAFGEVGKALGDG